LEKLLNSAVANAENNHDMDKNRLYVAECFVSPGPTMKRIRPMSHGRAFKVLKRSSHVTLALKEKEEAK
jgi:large subunit ribosomal protein L22